MKSGLIYLGGRSLRAVVLLSGAMDSPQAALTAPPIIS